MTNTAPPSIPATAALDSDTLVGRCTAAFTEALMDLDAVDDNWVATAIRELLPHVATELLVHQQNIVRPLSLHDAAKFLVSEADR